jgi:hypothetical protein
MKLQNHGIGCSGTAGTEIRHNLGAAQKERQNPEGAHVGATPEGLEIVSVQCHGQDDPWLPLELPGQLALPQPMGRLGKEGQQVALPAQYIVQIIAREREDKITRRLTKYITGQKVLFWLQPIEH